ncbi:putative Tether containing UBX domain for GLUT4 [Glarea lozoyensis 74030]|uniref:Putative Tether containing UBX domain for GLUT4 n=1 Tax=Glarea lozoyensis (strain ATCC 74030 / MF5533) TaxID=1104152 RepID=H0ETS4_GLAL7|nr:putative Tether containing UBX domain for GLUT4 [Glarea lozoyensis 74030]
MTDVLGEACRKFGVKSANYTLKYKGKPVDLSRTYRQTGLVSGAKLELVVASRSPSVVSVALQLPDVYSSSVPNGRLTDKFPSDTTLWLILRKFENTPEHNFNFTARGVSQVENGNVLEAKIFYEKPVVQLMAREFSSFEELQQTLAQLGFNSGTGLIKLKFSRTTTPLEEARGEISAHFKQLAEKEAAAKEKAEAEAAAKAESDAKEGETAEAQNVIDSVTGDVETPPTNKGVAGDVEMTDASQPPEPSAAASTSEAIKEDVLGPGQRPISIYSPPSSDTPKAALQPVQDDDFEPSIVHAKLHQDRLKNSSHNKRLLSNAEEERLEKEKAAKLAAAKEVSVKIRFPDQATIVSPFKADETGADLYTYVSNVIRAGDQPFKLVWNGKGVQTVPKDDKKKLIKDLKFDARMLINFVWEDGVNPAAKKAPILKPEFDEKAQEIPVPEVRPLLPQSSGSKIGDTMEKAGQDVAAKNRGHSEELSVYRSHCCHGPSKDKPE